MSVEPNADLRTDPDLPELVSRYVGRDVPHGALARQSVRFSQLGDMQLKPGRWLSFRAEQEMAVERVD